MGSIVNTQVVYTTLLQTQAAYHVNLKVCNAEVVLSTEQTKGRTAWCFMMNKYPNVSCQFVKLMWAARQIWTPAEFYSQTVFGANIWFDLLSSSLGFRCHRLSCRASRLCPQLSQRVKNQHQHFLQTLNQTSCICWIFDIVLLSNKNVTSRRLHPHSW